MRQICRYAAHKARDIADVRVSSTCQTSVALHVATGGGIWGRNGNRGLLCAHAQGCLIDGRVSSPGVVLKALRPYVSIDGS